MKHWQWVLMALWLPHPLFALDLPPAAADQPAAATEISPHLSALPQAQPKKFIPLNDARSIRGDQERDKESNATKKPFPLRSDSEQMKDGFMRLDRNKNLMVPSRASVVVKSEKPASALPASTPALVIANTAPSQPLNSLEPESEEIAGNKEGIDPVLALFGGGTGAPTSFRDAMRGGGTGSIDGVTRHAIWPLPLYAKQYMSSGFGPRADPFNGRPSFHGGIDIAADTGTPVMATADGEVKEVAQDAGYGKYITLQHADGMLSRYGHLSLQAVNEGERVKAGQVIGTVGATGRATGPHLDYRVSKNGLKFDPLAVLTLPPSVEVHTGFGGPRFAAAKPEVAVTRGAIPQSKVMHPISRAPMIIQVH